MSEPEVIVDDQEMETVPDITADAGDDNEPTDLEDIEPTIAERTGFVEYVT
jgi:hypothetical protein